MSPETSGGGHIAEPLEQKEWQGQRWEYLVLNVYGVASVSFLGRKNKPDGFFSSGRDVDPKVARLNDQLEKLRRETGLEVPLLNEALRFAGQDGWELVVNMEDVRNFLLFKRPLPPLE